MQLSNIDDVFVTLDMSNRWMSVRLAHFMNIHDVFVKAEVVVISPTLVSEVQFWNII